MFVDTNIYNLFLHNVNIFTNNTDYSCLCAHEGGFCFLFFLADVYILSGYDQMIKDCSMLKIEM